MSDPVNPQESTAGFRHLDCLPAEVYQELRALAARRMSGQANGHTLQPTVLVHEAWMRMAARDQTWHDRSHFFAVAAITMRHILIDHARRKSRLRHGGGLRRAETIGDLATPDPNEQLLQLDEGVTALEKVDPVRANIVIARFFGGLTAQEIAMQLGISERSVERHWAAAKVWLLRWMKEHCSL